MAQKRQRHRSGKRQTLKSEGRGQRSEDRRQKTERQKQERRRSFSRVCYLCLFSLGFGLLLSVLCPLSSAFCPLTSDFCRAATDSPLASAGASAISPHAS